MLVTVPQVLGEVYPRRPVTLVTEPQVFSEVYVPRPVVDCGVI